MRIKAVILSLMLLCIVLTSTAMADVVFLKEGKTYKGDIMRDTYDDIRIKLETGTRIIPKSMIKEIEWHLDVVYCMDGRVLKGKIISRLDGWITLRMKYGDLKLDSQVEVEELDKEIKKEKIDWKPRPKKQRSFSDAAKRLSLGDKYEFPEPTENLSPKEIQALHQKGMAFHQQKQYKEACEQYEKILRTNPKDVIALYNLACALSLMDKKKEAVHVLYGAVLAGYTDFVHMAGDTDLDNIRDTKDYKYILSKRDEIQRNAADLTLDRLKQQFGPGYTYDIDEKRRLICATNRSMSVLEQLQEHIGLLADAWWGDYFQNKPEFYITIVIPSRQDFERMRPRPGVEGWYNPRNKILICGDQSMTLDHEFTHALHFADQAVLRQKHPIHIAEGFATLAESSTIVNGDIIPDLISQRLPYIQQCVQMNRYMPWNRFFKVDIRTFQSPQSAGLCYSEVRYLFVYIYENGKLMEWYKEYVKGFEEDKTGYKAMEKVFGKSLAELEADWKTWVMTLKPKERPKGTGPGGAYMGVQTSDTPHGLAVKHVVQGGPADKAGLQEGDIIKEVDGKEISDLAGMLDIVRTKKPDDKLKLKVLRGSSTKELELTLGARPNR